MKKGLLIFFLAVAVLLVVLFAAPYLFKGKIMDAVKTEINNSVEARVEFTDVSLSLLRNFPDLTLSLKDLQVTGKEAFKEDTLVSFRSFGLSIDLGSILSGKSIKVNAITLDNPYVFAHVLPNGKANWDIAPETEEAAPETDTAAGEAPDIQMSLETFRINNGRIAYLDEAANMMAGLKGLNYELSGDFSAQQATLEQLLTAEAVTFIYDEIKYLNKAAVSFDASIGADLENYKFTFQENTFTVNNLKLNFDGWLSMPGEAINMDIRFDAPSARFKELLSLVPKAYMKDFEALEATGNFKLNGQVEGAYQDGKIPGFSVNLQVNDGRISYPDLPDAIEAVRLDASVDNPGGTGMENHVDVSAFHAEMAGNPLDGKLKVHTTESDVDMAGEMQGKLDLTAVQQFITLDSMEIGGLVNADMRFAGKLSDIENEAYENVSADGSLQLKDFTYAGPELPAVFAIAESHMEFSPKKLALKSFEARTGSSDLSMNGTLHNYMPYLFEDKTIRGTLNVSASTILASDFLVESEAAEPEDEPEDTTRMTAVKVPENIDFMLSANIGAITYDQINIEDFRGNIRVKEGTAKLENTQMQMLGGILQLSGTYDSRNIKRPEINFGMDIREFTIPETYSTFNTFKKLAPIAKYLSGSFSSSLEIAGALDHYLEPDLATFKGSGSLQSEAIQVENAPMFEKIASATGADRFKNPVLKDVNASFEVVDGRVFLESKTMKMGGQEFVVAGSQGLDQTMDYTIQTDIPRSALGSNANNLMNNLASKAGFDISGKQEIPLNISVEGKAQDPEIGVNFAESGKSAKEQVEDKVKEQLQKEKEKAKEKAKDELKKLQDSTRKEGEKMVDSLKKKAKKKKKDLKEKAKKKLKELW